MDALARTIFRLRQKRWLLGFAIILASLVTGLLVLELANRASGGIWLRDFQVFHRAGGRILSGEHLFQPDSDGFYSYKYSPTSALLFIPFSLLPFRAAEVIYWFFISGLVLTGFYLSLTLVYPDFRKTDPKKLALLLALAIMPLGIYIWSELTLGQINHLLLVMYIAIACLLIRDRPAPLALIWSLSLFIKPFGLVLLPYFILKKRFREIKLFLGFSTLLFILPAVFYGGDFFAEQKAWLREIVIELGNKGDLFRPGNHTLVSVIARYASLDALSPSPTTLTIYKLLVLSLVALVAALVIRKGSAVPRPEALDFAFILAVAPLVSYSNSNAFGMVELAVLLLIFSFRRLRLWEKAVAACGFVLIGGNFYDQLPPGWGQRFFDYYESSSLLSIGTVLLLACMVTARWRAAG